jgi:ubiquinone/menaquinone biosynthesis C-methylase UbiE
MPLAGVPDFDRVAERYDETRALPPQVMDSILGELKLHFSRGPRTLDAGCGTGRLLVPLQRAGWNTWGVDISREMLRKARASGADQLFRGDLRRLPLGDKKFDSALVFQVLHLIPDYKEAIREICRVCKVSVLAVSVEGEGPSLHDEYRELMRNRGLAPTAPSRTAFDLLKGIASKRFINEAARWETERPAEKELEALQDRLFSFQWRVPDEAHAEIMETLRKEHSGKVFYRMKRAFVGCWYIKDLEASLAYEAGEWPIRERAPA